MPIVSLNIPDSLLKELDLMVDTIGYSSRSEAIRDAVRTHMSEQRMYRRAKEEVYNAVIFVYKDGDDEKNKISRLRAQFSPVIEGEMTFSLGREKKLTLLLARGKSNDLRALTSRIRGIRGMEQTRYIMTDE
jgi:CopG family nickel-responsive transcriptional regulator